MSRKITLLILPFFLILLSLSDKGLDDKNLSDELNTANQLITLVNEHRETIGKPALIRNSTADKLAAEHADYMISKKEVSNDNFEIRWETLEQKENAQDIGENVGVDISAEQAMNAYLNRIWLKANVEGDFTHTGISVRKDAKGSYFYTQIFYR